MYQKVKISSPGTINTLCRVCLTKSKHMVPLSEKTLYKGIHICSQEILIELFGEEINVRIFSLNFPFLKSIHYYITYRILIRVGERLIN